MQQKILGIDYGSVYCGIAISDELQKHAFVYKKLPTRLLEQDLNSILERERIALVVLGLPLSLDGSMGPQAQKVKQIGLQLQTHLGIPVVFEDERLTTKMSKALSRQKGSGIDDHQLAAQEILQSYLDKKALANSNE